MKVFLALFVVAILVPITWLGYVSQIVIERVWNWAIAK